MLSWVWRREHVRTIKPGDAANEMLPMRRLLSVLIYVTPQVSRDRSRE